MLYIFATKKYRRKDSSSIWLYSCEWRWLFFYLIVSFGHSNILTKFLCRSFVRRVYYMGALNSSSRATTMATTFVNEAIASDKVVIFSKSYCPYCTMAKEVRASNSNVQFSKWFNNNFVSTAIQQAETEIHGHRIGEPRWLCRYPGCLGRTDWSNIGEIPFNGSSRRWGSRRKCDLIGWLFFRCLVYSSMDNLLAVALMWRS